MLKNSIFKTLAFFDAQDLALTLLEVRNYLVTELTPALSLKKRGSYPLFDKEGGGGVRIAEIQKIIETELTDKIEHRDGLYFLRSREELVNLRKSRYRTSLVRFFRAKKYLKFFRHLPYLRAVAISGSQALLNSGPESDIDLLIVTKKNRIWLARALVSSFLQILGQRRHGLKVSNRFCLNHYLAEDGEITEDRNLYTAVEYASLVPVLGEDAVEKFWQKNQWINEYLGQPILERHQALFGFHFSFNQKILEKVLDLTIGVPLNYLLGIYQKHRIRRQEHILVSDSELSFHPGSRGQQVLASFQKKL